MIACSFVSVYSQIESADSEIVLGRFQELYNTGQFDQIHAEFSDKAKANLPLKEVSDFLSQLKSKFGAIKKMIFLEYQGHFNVYKTDFEKGVMCLPISIQGKKIEGIYALPYDAAKYLAHKRNMTTMQLPFKDEWTVFWGGDTREQNYHVVVKFQQNALDLVINKNGKSYRTDGKKNEDYFSFSKEIIAPCDGEIVFSVDGIKDNVPGVLNSMYVLGNSILLKTKNNEYVLLAHFKQNSIKVKQDDLVKQGDLLGLSGNSGNSSEPHLHFHIQDMGDSIKVLALSAILKV